MKQVLFLLFCAFSLLTAAQNTPIEVTKETNLSKNELFSKTKMFISDKWNNPKRSILNEDKDSGIIQVKTEKEIASNVGMGLQCVYIYEYLTKFRMKDNKYRIEIYDIKCLSAQQVGLGTTHNVPLIPYFEGDNAPDKLKSLGKGISKKKAIQMMQELRNEFSTLFNQYDKYLSEEDDF